MWCEQSPITCSYYTHTHNCSAHRKDTMYFHILLTVWPYYVCSDSGLLTDPITPVLISSSNNLCFYWYVPDRKLNQTESRFTSVLLWKSLQMSVQSVGCFHVICNRLMTLLVPCVVLNIFYLNWCSQSKMSSLLKIPCKSLIMLNYHQDSNCQHVFFQLAQVLYFIFGTD